MSTHRPVPHLQPAPPASAVGLKAKVAERIRKVIFAIRPRVKTPDQVVLDRCLTMLADKEAYIGLGIGPHGTVAHNQKFACVLGLLTYTCRRYRDLVRSEIVPSDLEPSLRILEDLAAAGWDKYIVVADGPVWFKLERTA